MSDLPDGYIVRYRPAKANAIGARDTWRITYQAGDQEWTEKVYAAGDVPSAIARHQAAGAPTKRSRASVEGARDAAVVKGAAEGVPHWKLARRHGLTITAVGRIIEAAQREERRARRPRFVEETREGHTPVRRLRLRGPATVRFEPGA
ncbi:hypothetical protein [Microbacterium sp. No. 7]|uniref:hypothetical protein n=1 Tax=Microbacterium sp. No. 7 TaxID=1714373 RepID=UPI001E2F09F4|nr:hypothetical protein [Microbacterium sp. No. 7]